MEKQESKDPVQLIGLSPTKSGITFLNGNTGGRLLPNANVSFKYVDISNKNIKYILENGINGAFDIKGKIKWTTAERMVFVGDRKTTKQLRDGIIANDSAHMAIVIWAPYINDAKEDVLVHIKNVVLQTKFGVRLTTTTTVHRLLTP